MTVKKAICYNLYNKQKGRVATFSFTTPIRVLTNAVKVFERGETKKEVENDLLSFMAPQVGLAGSESMLC